MRQLVTQIKEKQRLAAQVQRSLRCFFIKSLFHILVPMIGFAQENPWSAQSGSNPWPSTTATETTPPVQALPSATLAEQNNTFREFYLNGDTLQISAEDMKQIRKNLISYGAGLENSNGYFAGGTVLASGLSVFALPFMTIASVAENAKAKEQLKTFKEHNPKATKKEVSYVADGLRNNRVKKGFLGVLTGILVNTAVLLGIAASF